MLKEQTTSSEDESSNVTVCVRCKPFTEEEIASGGERGVCCVEMPPGPAGDFGKNVGNKTIMKTPGTFGMAGGPLTRTFVFDKCLWSHNKTDSHFVTQKDLYDMVGASVLQTGWNGFNSTLFAYGSTGSGKSYSMMGNEKAQGIIPRLCQSLFAKVEAAKAKDSKILKNGRSSRDKVTDETNWVRGIDPETGCEYWYDFATKRSSWFPPDDPDGKAGTEMSTPNTGALATNTIETVYSVACSYLEIYNENVRDLLDTTGGALGKSIATTPEGQAFGLGRKKDASVKLLRVREDPKTGPYVEGLKSVAVSKHEEVAGILKIGNATRIVASTQMNNESSRSHAIFTIHFTQTLINHAQGTATDRRSKINLVDLAGSERVDRSGATGTRLREAAAINKSLSTLGQCINKLADMGSDAKRSCISSEQLQHRHSQRRKRLKKSFIPYRDSVLTWLLKESFGGNARTVMLATIRPSVAYYEETMSTLRYAERAKRIVNKAVLNEDPNLKIIRQLRAEVNMLRQRLAQQEQLNSKVQSVEPRVIVKEVVKVVEIPVHTSNPAAPSGDKAQASPVSAASSSETVREVVKVVYQESPAAKREIAALRLQNAMRSKVLSKLKAEVGLSVQRGQDHMEEQRKCLMKLSPGVSPSSLGRRSCKEDGSPLNVDMQHVSSPSSNSVQVNASTDNKLQLTVDVRCAEDSTPSDSGELTVPALIYLHPDDQFNEKLSYEIYEGRTIIGSVDPEIESVRFIKLEGAAIEPQHALLERVGDRAVVITPLGETGDLIVNGRIVSQREITSQGNENADANFSPSSKLSIMTQGTESQLLSVALVNGDRVAVGSASHLFRYYDGISHLTEDPPFKWGEAFQEACVSDVDSASQGMAGTDIAQALLKSSAGAEQHKSTASVPDPISFNSIDESSQPTAWYYRAQDGTNNIEGPFQHSHLVYWYQMGYLPAHLPVRKGKDGNFEALINSLFEQNGPRNSPQAHSDRSSAVNTASEMNTSEDSNDIHIGSPHHASSPSDLKRREESGILQIKDEMEIHRLKDSVERMKRDVTSAQKESQQILEKQRLEYERKIAEMKDRQKVERDRSDQERDEERKLAKTSSLLALQEAENAAKKFARLEEERKMIMRGINDIVRRRLDSERAWEAGLRSEETLCKLKDDMLQLLPVINESNAIAQVLAKPVSYRVDLLEIPVMDENGEEKILRSAGICVTNAVTNRHRIWQPETLMSRLPKMRRLYRKALDSTYGTYTVRGSAKKETTQTWSSETDPFYLPPSREMLGRAQFYIGGACYGITIDQCIPIISLRGSFCGKLRVRADIVPENFEGGEILCEVGASQMNTNMKQVGDVGIIRIQVYEVQGIPEGYSSQVEVQFDLCGRKSIQRESVPSSNENTLDQWRDKPSAFPLNVYASHSVLSKDGGATEDFIVFLKTRFITLNVYGWTIDDSETFALAQKHSQGAYLSDGMNSSKSPTSREREVRRLRRFRSLTTTLQHSVFEKDGSSSDFEITSFEYPKEHLLFASIDVREKSRTDEAKFEKALLDHASQAPLFNLSPESNERQLVISITQADREEFAIESLSAVTLGPLTAWHEGKPLTPDILSQEINNYKPKRCLDVIRSTRSKSERMLRASVTWNPTAHERALRHTASLDDCIVEMPVVIDLFLSKIALPVQLVMNLRLKLTCDSGTRRGRGSSSTFHTMRRKFTSWANERGDPIQRRVQRLGRRFVINVSHGRSGSGCADVGTPLKTPHGVTRAPTAVPSVLSSQAMALLNMRKILKTEQIRQIKELQARLVAADVPQIEVEEFSRVIETQAINTTAADTLTKVEAVRNRDKITSPVPVLLPAPRGHRNLKSWVNSDLEQLSIHSVGTNKIISSSGSDIQRQKLFDASGYLLKRRALIGGWARRYFVVTWPLLSYWISAEDHLSETIEARGVFDLSKSLPRRGKGPFDIELHHYSNSNKDSTTENKKWVLQASSEEELERWIDALTRGQRKVL